MKARSAFDDLFAALPAAVRARADVAARKLNKEPPPHEVARLARHIPLSLAERRLVERAAEATGATPEVYARAALIAQSRAIIELAAKGHFTEAVKVKRGH